MHSTNQPRALKAAFATAAVAVAGLSALATIQAEQADARSTSCKSHGSRTAAKNSTAGVYLINGAAYGCLFSSGRRVLLGGYGESDTGEEKLSNFRLAGRYVAFGDENLQGGGSGLLIEFTVHVFDLRSGKRKSLSETGPATKEALRGWMGSANGIGPVVGLRLRATGDVAWIAQAYGTESMPFYEIRRREGSRIRRLAAGTDISPTSLRLSGNRLTWLQAGHASEARLGK